MAEVTSAMVKELREKTGAGMMDCKKALLEAGGDAEKAVTWLREKGLATAGKKAGRSATEGAVGSYIHLGGKRTVQDVLNESVAVIGENIQMRRYTRYALGEGLTKATKDFAAEVSAAVNAGKK